MDDALVLLRLQIEFGADEAIDAGPIDRLRPMLQPPETKPTRLTSTVPVALEARTGTPAERALMVAAGANSLDDLRTVISAFDGCALRNTASNLVFVEGDPASSTLIIGEAPGREEDRGGHPFAGPEGLLLDQMLGSIGLLRTDLMLTPLLPWRPPGGRPASPTEIAICLPFLHRLIVLLKPKRIVLFGGSVARALLPPGQSRRRNPRIWFDVSIPGLSASVPAVALPSLAEMLKIPPSRRDAWAGLRLLRRSLDGIPTQT